MAYNKHEWNAGEAITAPKMNTLETAVQNVAALADKLVADTGKDTGKESLQKQINDANSSITTVSTWIDGPGDRLRAEVEGSDGLMAQVTGLHTSTENGEAAWQQVASVITRDSQGNVQTSLKTVVDNIKKDITDVNNTIGAGYSADNTISTVINTEITARRSNDDAIRELITNAATGQESFYGSEAPTTLQQRVADLMTGIDRKANQSALSTATTAIGNQAKDIANIQSEIKAAHRSENDTLDARLDDIEAAATTAATTAAQYNDETYVKKSQIKDSLDIETSGNVLDARQGQILNTHITKIKTALDGFIDTKTVQSEIDALENRINGKIVDSDKINTVISPGDSTNITSAKVGKELYSELSSARISQAIRTPGQNEGDPDTDTTYNSLDERLEAIEGRANTASDAFEQLQTEILTARASNVKGTEDEETHEITPLEYGSLDARFEAAEGDIHKIASELKMYNQAGAIQDATTRIDTIEKNVLEMGKEIGMITDLEEVQTLSDTIDRASTYIDKVKNEIAGAHRTDEDTLSTRFSSVESSISGLNSTITNAETGLAKTKEIADEALGKANAAAVATEVTSALAGKASTESVDDLAGRVHTLETAPKSATVVIDNVTYDNDGNPTDIGTTPSPDADYLLKKDNKYYYWKYIPNNTDPVTYTWALISGGASEGGVGTSSAQIVSTLPAADTADINTDYYVGNNNDGYLHYRYIEQSGSSTPLPILIGVDPTKLKTYNIIKTIGGTESEPINYLDLYEFNYGENNTLRDDDLPSDTKRIAHIVLPQGGGGSATTANTKLVRIAPTSITTIFNNQGIFLRFFYSCYDNSGESHEGTYSLRNSNNIELLTDKINSGAADATVNGWPDGRADGVTYDDGYVSLNVEPFCRLGMNTFNLVMTTGTNETLYRQYTVDIKELRLESDAPETLITDLNSTAELVYTPFGALEKYLHVSVDDNEIDTVLLRANNTGNELTYNIPAQAQGHHKIQFYLSTELNGKPINTDPPITRDYIWRDSTAEDITILASSYRDSIKEVTQYDEVEIPYTLYSTDSSVLVEYYYDYNPEQENTPFSSAILTNTNSGILRYSANEAGDHTLTIKANDAIITIGLDVTDLPIDIAPVGGAIIDFNPALLTNTSVGREPEWVVNKGLANEKTYKLSVSDNFNWSTNVEDSGGGYRDDVDGKCFIIRAGDYATLNYKMFTQNNVGTDGITKTTSKVFDQGVEMKIIFKVSAVRDAKAVWLTNMGKYVATDDKQVGIELSAHSGRLMTDKATSTATKVTEEDIIEQGYVLWEANHTYTPGDIVVVKKKTIYECITETTNSVFDDDEEKKWRKIGQLETEVSATNSYLYFPYSEDDKIELDININKTGNGEDFIMSYEDGVPSKAYPYDYAAGGDILYQIIGQESDIRIGSPDCDVYIYRIKIYDNALQTNQILKNFIADGKDINERVDRYNRNSIYYNSSTGEFTPYASSSAILDPIQLAKQLPDVKILMLETPRFTTGKKDFVRGTLRCIQAKGGKVYPATDEDNWFFFNGYHAGQGTTSDNYGQSARNVDFLFECDGVHYPTKKKNLTDFEKNWRSAVIHGNEGSVYRDLRDPANPADNQVIRGQWEAAQGATIDECIYDENHGGWMGTECKVSLTHDADSGEDTSIPNNYFNLKVNVASSENVNNALFQKRYNDFLPYTSPAKQRDSRIKNGMEFVPAILFIRETGTGSHSEFDDNNWHFYALGNIGDSKKSDYTRAYDPEDMNEFTIEISDNNTANSQFQSGVYKNASTNNVETIETSATETDPMDYVYPISFEQWNAKDEQEQYINYRHKTLSTEDFDGDHSFEFRYACCGDYRDGDLINDTHGDSTVPNPDPEEANDKPYLTKDDVQFDLNRGIWEAFYEWVVTADETQFRNEASLWIVPEAMEFFYAFTHYYTMMDNRAKNTFWHFAKTNVWKKVPIGRAISALFHIYEIDDGNGGHRPIEATETFDNTKQYWTQYAFDLWIYDTDTACGIDNNGELVFPYGKEDLDYREANDPNSGWAFNGSGSIFWRRLSTTFADGVTTIMRQSPVECFSDAQDLINQFDKFQECYPEEIWRLDIQRKYIRTFTGKSYDNSITTGKQNIRFLKAMMQGRKKYQRRQWVRDQSIYFGSKYFLNNVGTDTHTIEFNTYTPTADGVTSLAVPVDREHVVVVPYQDMYINVAVGNSTTNIADRIITDQYAKRAKAGDRVTIDCRSGGSAQETRVYIYGAEHIAAIENLAPAYTYSGSFGQGVRLKRLDLGSDNPDYNNPRFTSLSINARMPILESFSVKNCNMLGGTINLSQSNNLRTFEAEGSAITGISLPNYTHIQQLHLPSTVTNLTLTSAHDLSDFYIHDADGEASYTSLISLNIDDSDYSSNINWLDIAKNALNGSLDTLYLRRLSHASINNITELEPFAARKRQTEVNYDSENNLIQKIVLTGILNVTGSWSTIEKSQYGAPNGIWPNLEFNTIAENEQTKCKVTYYHSGYWRNGTYIEPVAITTKFITQGDVIPDIYEGKSGTELPSRDPTIESVFTFGAYDENSQYMVYTGWTKSANESTAAPLGNLDGTGNSAANPLRVSIQDGDALNLYTYYYKEDHKYTVRWKLDNDVIATRANQYYGRGYDLEAPTVAYMRQNGKTLVKDFKFNSNGTVSYKIFDGWNKLPTNISPTEEEARTGYYDIIAVWKEVTKTLNDSDINGVFYDTSNITAEQLLVLSHMNSVDRTGKALTIVPQKTFTYEMGYDSKVEGTTVFTNRRLIGGSESNNSITPFAARTEDKGFTIAIDYQFGATTNSTYPEVLVGCYARDSATGSNITGFALYRGYEASRGGAGINVCYNISPNNNNSSQRVAVGDTSHRNIIVLRRPKGTNTLHIYSARSADATTSLNTEIQVSTIPLTSSLVFNSDAKICLGALRPDITDNKLYSSSEGNNTRIAQGSVYWLKYWDEDLGAGECKALAAWPHETMTAIITAQNSNATNESDKLGLFLHNLNCSNHMNVWQDRFVTGNYEVSTGWDFVDEEDEEKTSVMRGICIKRIFPGLPTELQTIINAPKIGYYRYNRTQGQDSGSSVVTLGEVYTDQGFVYPPSISSINYSEYARYAAESIIERTGANIESTSDITPYVWTGTAATRITAYEPASYTSDSITWNRITPSSKWLNIRFNEWPLLFTSQLRVFVIKSGSLNRTFYAAINDSSNSSGAAITIQQNDIVIDVTDDNNVQGVYMYINSTNQSAYAIQTKAQVDKFATGTSTGRVGGWISSVPYVTRSVTDQTGTYPNFIYIKIDGTEISPSNNSDTQNVQGLQTIDFSFAI